MEDNIKKRGGARPGAGRPKGDSRMISFRAPGALADKLDEIENRTEFIKSSIDKALRERESGIGWIEGMVPAGEAPHVSIPFFDIRVVAGFPVPLDNDEKAPDTYALSASGSVIPHTCERRFDDRCGCAQRGYRDCG